MPEPTFKIFISFNRTYGYCRKKVEPTVVVEPTVLVEGISRAGAEAGGVRKRTGSATLSVMGQSNSINGESVTKEKNVYPFLVAGTNLSQQPGSWRHRSCHQPPR